MKKIIAASIFLISCLSSRSYGQYSGGVGEGSTKVISTKNLGNNIFRGGSDDGFTLISYTGNLGNSIFKGGRNDGVMYVSATTNLGNNIFKGGNSDGEAFLANQINLGLNIFKGGTGDGETKIATTINAGTNIFKGGNGDGFDRVSVSILLQPGVYVFSGSGLWTNSSNWSNNVIPPAILPSAYKIIIDPQDGKECILNTIQTIKPGATFIMNPHKTFRIQSDVKIQ